MKRPAEAEPDDPHATGVSADAEVRGPAFVGRRRESAAIIGALTAGPSVVLVEGEPGIGKTRLLRESLATLTATEPGRVLVGTCPPLRRPLTLGPVADAVRQAVGSPEGRGLSELSGSLVAVFPEWAGALPPVPDEPSGDASVVRQRLFWALTELMQAVGVSVLAIDDCQWADEVTLEFLLCLAAQQPQPLSLIAAYRPGDVTEDSLLRLLAARSGHTRVTLTALDMDDVSDFVASMLGGQQVSESFARFVHERTDGVPLLVEESVRLMHEREDLVVREGRWERHSLGALQVPATVRDSVLERLRRLSPDARAVVLAASVLAQPAGIQVLARVADLPPDRAGPAAVEATTAGLLAHHDPDLLEVAHVLVSHAVYESVEPSTRARLHLRAARALQAGLHPSPAALAHHLRQGGDEVGWCRYAVRASAVAAGAGDDETAIRALLDVLLEGRLSEPPRLRLALRLADTTLYRKGVSNELVAAVAKTLGEVVEDEALPGPARAEVRCRLSRILRQLGDKQATRAQLEKAIPHLVEARRVEAAGAMIYLGWPQFDDQPASVHLDWLRRAADCPLDTASAASALALRIDRAVALLQLGEASGWQLVAELPASADTVRERRELARGRLNIGGCSVLWGHYDRARSAFAAGLKLAESDQYRFMQRRIEAGAAQLDWLSGRWPEAASGLDDGDATDDASPPARLDTALVAGLLAERDGDTGTARRLLSGVLDEALRHGSLDTLMDAAAGMARIAMAASDLTQALEMTEEPVRVISVKGIWPFATDVVPARVAALLAAERGAEAARLVREFGAGLEGRDIPSATAALAVSRALLAEESLGPSEAEPLWLLAVRCWQRLPRPYDMLLAQERQAACLADTSGPDAAAPLLKHALDGFSGLGALPDARRVAGRLRELGVAAQPSSRERHSYGNQLSPREIEIVRLFVTGLTDRAIAKTLFLSPRTVGHHLDSARREPNAPSRAILARTATEAGLV